MNCSELRSRISELLDQELSYSDAQIFKGDLAGCEDCSEIHVRLEQMKLVLAEEPLVSLPPDFIQRLQIRLKEDMALKNSWWQQMLTPRMAGLSPLSMSGMALAAVVALIVGVSLFQIDTAPLVEPPRAVSSRPVAPTAGGFSPGGSVRPPIPVQAPATMTDSLHPQRDSSRRDFSRQMKLGNQNRP